jgi:hypothetical protein
MTSSRGLAPIAFAVLADANGVGFQVAVSDHEHGVLRVSVRDRIEADFA